MATDEPGALARVRAAVAAAYGRHSVRVWVGYLLLALVYTCPLYLHPTYAGGHLDWRLFHYFHEASRITVLEYGQLPLWNPWGCGGNVHLGNAQTQFLSPYFAFMLMFGVAIGQKLFILIHFWLGLVGMHQLVSRDGRTPIAAVGSAVVFGLCGFHAMRAGGGHAAFAPFLYLPWLIMAYQAARERPSRAILVGLIVAEAVLEGGIYPTAFFIVLLVFQSCYDLITGPVPRWRILAVGAIAGAIFASVAAIKLGPVMQFLQESPRPTVLDDRLDLTIYLKAFTSRSLQRHLPGHEFVWHEYMNYIGVIPLLAVLFMWSRRDEEPLRRWYYALALFSLLMLGDHGRYSPYALMHHLPIFGSLRVPSRYGILVVFHVALVFGVFLNWLDYRCDDRARRIQRPWLAALWRRGAYIVLILVALDIGISTARLWAPGFNTKPHPRIEQPFFQGHGNGNDMWWRMGQNEGTPNCYEANFIPPAKGLWKGKGPQARLAPGVVGTINAVEFTPNRWRLSVEVPRGGRALVNMNHHRFWRLERGPGSLLAHEGVIAVDLPAGTHQIVLRYWPDHLGWFITASMLGLLASVLGLLLPWWLQRRRA